MDVLLSVDPSAEAPLHRQIYDALRRAILSGQLRAGDRLPATRALAEELSLSRTTVAEAYDQLQAEGYVLGRHGSGTYVAPNLPDDGFSSLVGESRSPVHSRPTTRLSSWGRKVTVEEYRGLFRASAPESYPYDLRPHLVAQDQFPWETWRAAVDRALRGAHGSLLSYPPPAGHPDLLRAIAAHVRKYRAVICSPEQVVIVNGSQQGLNLLAELLLETGERAAVEDPGYPAARLALEARRLQVSRIPVDGDGIIVDLLAATGPYQMIHVTPSHQHPTGATLSLARRLALLDLAERTGCLLVEDDYDSEFRYEGRPVESLQGLDRNGLVVYAGTFSKSLLPGLRIGFLVLPPHLVAAFVAARSLWDGGAPILEQSALAEFMRSGDFERHIRRMRRLYRGRRDALIAALSDVFGERAIIGKRHGGLNVLVSLDVRLSEMQVTKRATEAGVGLRPASPYYADPPAHPSFLVGFGALTEERIREGIELLGQIVR